MTAGLLCAALALPLRAAPQTEPSAVRIIDLANKTLRGDSSHARLTMTLVTSNWTRKLEVEGWNRDRQDALILIHAPAKDKGTSTLRIKSEMWLWKPNVERVIKIPPTMMHSSWMGSDFTYDDIVKADSVVRDYDHKILSVKRETPATGNGGWDLYHIESTPKPDAPVVWGKVHSWGRLYPDGGVLPVREQDFSERGELIRTIELSEVKVLDGRRVPTRLVCTPHRKPGQKTVLNYHSLDFDVAFPANFFSLERLQRSP